MENPLQYTLVKMAHDRGWSINRMEYEISKYISEKRKLPRPNVFAHFDQAGQVIQSYPGLRGSCVWTVEDVKEFIKYFNEKYETGEN